MLRALPGKAIFKPLNTGRIGEIIHIGDIKIECLLVPGHTWGHMVYLIDDEYLFTKDTIWFGADRGYGFIATLAEDNKLSVRSLEKLEHALRARTVHLGKVGTK